MLKLTLKQQPIYPVEAGTIVPDRWRNLSLQQIGEIGLVHGNRSMRLDDFFSIEGDPRDEILEIQGDCRLFKGIGSGMQSGFLKMLGPSGWHTGAHLRGGKIELHGDTGDHLGSEMRGGEIRLFGNAGHAVGGAYPGSRQGMRGGTIFVEGNCGHEVGSKMRRGLIAIRGCCGDYLGVNMIAGTIVCLKEAGIRAGAGLKRGSLLCFGGVREIPLNYHRSHQVDLTFLRLLTRFLTTQGFQIPPSLLQQSLVRYCGDLLSIARGELLLPEPTI